MGERIALISEYTVQKRPDDNKAEYKLINIKEDAWREEL